MENLIQDLEIELGDHFFNFKLDFEVEEGEKGLYAAYAGIKSVSATNEKNELQLTLSGQFVRKDTITLAMCGIPSDLWRKELKRAEELANDEIGSRKARAREDAADLSREE